jgi:hypothetical protein
VSLMRRFIVLFTCVSALLSWSPLTAGALVTHSTVVSENPADGTPSVLDGQVNAIVQIGDEVIVGGTFTRVADSTGAEYARPYLFAFSAQTQLILPAFNGSINSVVTSILAAPDGRTIYIGGSFTAAGGQVAGGLARLSAPTGYRVKTFQAPIFDHTVTDLARSGDHIIVAGSFSTVGGVSRPALASVAAKDGLLDSFVNLGVADPRPNARLKVTKIEVTPNGETLIAIGNFSSVSGVQRDQIAVVHLTGAAASVAAWATDVYQPQCARRTPTYMRDLAVAPDGTWFIVTTGGGSYPGLHCDSVSRFEISPQSLTMTPVWANYSGGDTLTAGIVTGAAVYVGGHQRWMNNQEGRNNAGPGAVDRVGIAAVDPATGALLDWNPGRDRGAGVFAFLATDSGLWIGSDTSVIAGETHPRIAFLPL